MGIVVFIIPLGVAIILHEYAHGWMANRLGDPTARLAGRLTLNPLAHIDPFGSIIFPLLLIMMRSPFLFGWAKPVPVNFAALGNPKRDMIWVAMAGPLTNILLALFSALLLRIGFVHRGSLLQSLLFASVLVNLILAVFNLIPVPPLDGSRIAMGIFPYELSYRFQRLESFGFFIIIILLFTGVISMIIRLVVFPLAQLLIGGPIIF